ncbi:MAG TPA: alpha/beta fold hydrolase, partial [bacterium]|nr:alpha/beta fold hydrolase [bacterium]
MPERIADDAARWQEEIQRNAQRMTNFAALMLNPAPPVVGATPREEIYRKGKARLYRYASSRSRHFPLLFVPNLGLSRPYVFDLTPGGSFIEYMTGQGFDFFLLDWGQFGPEDRYLTMGECVTRILPRMIKKVLDISGADELSMLGYCMGATLTASYLGFETEPPVASFINMAGPIDFSKSGLFGVWLDKRYFNADNVADTFGQLPVEMVMAGMKLLKPTMELTSRLNLWWNMWNEDY